MLFCTVIVFFSPLKTVTAELAARTRPNLFDLAVALFAAAPAFAQAFPDRPIRFVIPWPPGGTNDTLQAGLEAYWRPFGYGNGRLFELYGAGNKHKNKARFKTVADAQKVVDAGPEAIFDTMGIKVTWFDYEGYPDYRQLWGALEPGVTILDLLFNEKLAQLFGFRKSVFDLNDST